MSNKYCLPINVRVLSPIWIARLVIAIHVLPAPLLYIVVEPLYATLMSILLSFSMISELRKQHIASDLSGMMVTTSGKWQILAQDNRTIDVQLLDGVVYRSIIVMLLRRNNRKFRLVIQKRVKDDEQYHRLKVLLVNRSRGMD